MCNTGTLVHWLVCGFCVVNSKAGPSVSNNEENKKWLATHLEVQHFLSSIHTESYYTPFQILAYLYNYYFLFKKILNFLYSRRESEK